MQAAIPFRFQLPVYFTFNYFFLTNCISRIKTAQKTFLRKTKGCKGKVVPVIF